MVVADGVSVILPEDIGLTGTLLPKFPPLIVTLVQFFVVQLSVVGDPELKLVALKPTIEHCACVRNTKGVVLTFKLPKSDPAKDSRYRHHWVLLS